MQSHTPAGPARGEAENSLYAWYMSENGRPPRLLSLSFRVRTGRAEYHTRGREMADPSRLCTGTSTLQRRVCYSTSWVHEGGLPGAIRTRGLIAPNDACWLGYTTERKMVSPAALASAFPLRVMHPKHVPVCLG